MFKSVFTRKWSLKGSCRVSNLALAGELCLLGLAELPREDCGIPSEEPLLGPSEARLGLHLEMDQRLLHRSDWSCLLPQVAA